MPIVQKVDPFPIQQILGDGIKTNSLQRDISKLKKAIEQSNEDYQNDKMRYCLDCVVILA